MRDFFSETVISVSTTSNRTSGTNHTSYGNFKSGTKADVIFAIDVSETTNMGSLKDNYKIVKSVTQTWARRHDSVQVLIIIFSRNKVKKINVTDLKNKDKFFQEIQNINKDNRGSNDQANGNVV